LTRKWALRTIDLEPIKRLPIMRAKTCAIAVISVTTGLFWVVGETRPLMAQGPSLADVAKHEQERRKTISAPSKVLTNDDLKPVPPGSPAPSAPSDAAAAPAGGGDAAPAPADDGNKADGTEKDQAYWSKRMVTLQNTVSRNEGFAVALQSRINALANEYTNQGDGVQQLKIAADRRKAIAELDRLNKEIADGKKAIADLQEEARRAGVPPGWLR
jgi:hypothetical protein